MYAKTWPSLSHLTPLALFPRIVSQTNTMHMIPVSGVCFWEEGGGQTRTVFMLAHRRQCNCVYSNCRDKNVRGMAETTFRNTIYPHTLYVGLLGCLYIVPKFTSWFISWIAVLASTICSCTSKPCFSMSVSPSVKDPYHLGLTTCWCYFSLVFRQPWRAVLAFLECDPEINLALFLGQRVNVRHLLVTATSIRESCHKINVGVSGQIHKAQLLLPCHPWRIMVCLD